MRVHVHRRGRSGARCGNSPLGVGLARGKHPRLQVGKLVPDPKKTIDASQEDHDLSCVLAACCSTRRTPCARNKQPNTCLSTVWGSYRQPIGTPPCRARRSGEAIERLAHRSITTSRISPTHNCYEVSRRGVELTTLPAFGGDSGTTSLTWSLKALRNAECDELQDRPQGALRGIAGIRADA